MGSSAQGLSYGPSTPGFSPVLCPILCITARLPWMYGTKGFLRLQALVQANENVARLQCISLFTTGVMFFGATHRGIEKRKFEYLMNLLRSFTPFDPDPLLLASIDKSHPECERLHKRFSMVHAHYHYVSVYEDQPYRNKDLGLVGDAPLQFRSLTILG